MSRNGLPKTSLNLVTTSKAAHRSTLKNKIQNLIVYRKVTLAYS